jgi:glycosyltransferase involved in cell wall biosynthesis
MRILFLSHYFFPEGNAPATRVTELARRWARLGHDVTVVTCAPNVPNGVVYEGYRNRLVQRETVDGVEVIRVWTWLAANQGAVRRILNYVSYLVSACVAGLFVRRPEVLIATSPQFFCGWAGVLLSRVRRVPLLLEIRDLWPESIVAVGAMSSPRLIRFLELLERWMYAAADRIVTVGEGYREGLLARGVERRRITVIPNGVDRKAFSNRSPDPALREELAVPDAFVCAYVGTIGMGCGLEVVLRAARLLRARGRDDLCFLLVGDGAIRARLEREAREQGLSRVVFTGRVDKSRIPDVLALCDACLVHLTRTPLFRTVMPSKILEAAAMAKPIVLGVEGFAAELVGRAGAGICIEPENEHDLVEAVTALAGDPERAARLGAAAYERIARRHDWDELARRYLETLEGLVGRGRRR